MEEPGREGDVNTIGARGLNGHLDPFHSFSFGLFDQLWNVNFILVNNVIRGFEVLEDLLGLGDLNLGQAGDLMLLSLLPPLDLESRGKSTKD